MKQILPSTIFLLFAFFSFAQKESFSCKKIKNSFKGGEVTVLADNQRSDTTDILKYTINLRITDFTSPDTIWGNTVVRFTPLMNNINTVSLDLLKLTIDSIKVNTSVTTYTYDDTLLILNLPATHNIGDTSDITVFYHGDPVADASWGGWYNQSGYAYNLGVGFDAIPHNYGRVWFPCFDNFVERSKYEFNITTTGGKIAYCNGFLAADTTIGSLRTRTWVMNDEIPSYLAMVAVSNYTHVNQTFSGMLGTIPVMLTALPADTTNMKNSFINLSNALAAYENRYGPYRWNRVGYTLIPFNNGAMEHATNISYPKICANGSLFYQDIMAHEFSHHWFGDLATCQTAQDMWLNEGMAVYSEYIFEEWLYGQTTYKNLVRANHEDMLHYVHIREGGYLTLNNIPLNYTYGEHVYNKGADIAHTMRGYLGDSLFFVGLKGYLNDHQFTDANSTDMMNSITTATGYNMTDFFNGWVFNPGWPNFSIDSFISVPNGGNYDVTVYVHQKLTGSPSYYNNVPLEIIFKAANWVEQTRVMNVSGQYSSQTFTVPINPVMAMIDRNEKISDAFTSDEKVLTTTGNSFSQTANGRMRITVQSITDSAYVRVEHHWANPDPFQSWSNPYQLSTHWWKVAGILPSNFDASALINYDGRLLTSGGNGWMDNTLLPTSNLEDSIVLFYRPNKGSNWTLFPYYTKTIGSATDRWGSINIDSLLMGEYVIAAKNYLLSVPPTENGVSQIFVFPNPTDEMLTIDLGNRNSITALRILNILGEEVFLEYTSSGRMVLSTSSLKEGIYFISAESEGKIIGREKFVVIH